MVTATSANAQNRVNTQNYNLPNIKQQIDIDGNIDEDAWKQAISFELDVETRPGENTKAPVRTTVYMFDDGENLYVAFKAYDDNPSQIRAHYHDHDYIFDDDVVGFKVDTYNDNLRTYQFFVNALGVKHDSIEDGALQEDDLSWDAIWDAAAIITEDGYQAEFSVPLRILRFDDSKSEQKWGFDLLRFYPREVNHRLSYHGVDRDNSCYLCQNATITGLKNIKTGENLAIVPFLTATQNQSRDNPVLDDWDNPGVDTDIGMDFRWGITADTTLNATINPDFQQVESDVSQLEINNAFSLFFPEQRPFFVEGADYYKSLMNLVHTRNISDPDYGAKVTHSSDNNNYAAFVANDTQTNYILPGNSSSRIVGYAADSLNGVFRYRRDLENTSSFGTLVTLRKADDYYNYVYGLDGSLRLSDADVLRAQVLLSETEDPQQIVDSYGRDNNKSDGSAIDIHYRHQDRDWIWWTRYTRLSKGFRADLGFQPRVDYARYVTGFRHFWYEQNDHWWNTLSAGIDTRNMYDLNGDLLQRWVNGTVSYQGPWQSSIELNVFKGEQFWDGRIYDTRELRLSANVTPVSGLILRLKVSKEKAIDFANSRPGDLISISPRVTLNLGRHFQTEIRYTRQKMDVTGEELFTSSLLDARLIYQFSVESFLRLIIQLDDNQRNQNLYSFNVDASREDLGTQLLYSYKVNQDTVFYLGYSDTAYDDDSLNKLEKTGKTIFLKMSYSWLY